MDSPPHQKPERARLHNFDLPSELKWKIKRDTPPNSPPPRRPRSRFSRRPATSSSSSSPRQLDSVSQTAATDDSPGAGAGAGTDTDIVLEPLFPGKEEAGAAAVDFTKEEIPKPAGSGGSSGIPSRRFVGVQTDTADSGTGGVIFKATPLPSGDSSGSPGEKLPGLRFKIIKSGGGSPSSGQPPPPRSTPLRSPHIVSRPGRGSSSSSGGGGGGEGPPYISFNAVDRELECIDLLNSGFAQDDHHTAAKGNTTADDSSMEDDFTFEADELLELLKNFPDAEMDDEMDEDPGPEEEIIADEITKSGQNNEDRKKEERPPIKTYVRTSKKEEVGRDEREKRGDSKLQPIKIEPEQDEYYKYPFGDDRDPIDLETKIWNLRTRNSPAATPKAAVLNLERKKNTGSSAFVPEGKGKQVADDAEEGGQGKTTNNTPPDNQNKNKKKATTGKGKGKVKEEPQEFEDLEAGPEPEQSDPRLPRVRVQLSPSQIAEDLIVLGITPRLPKKLPVRPKKVQRGIDQVTPGLWLEGITMERYQVPEDNPPKAPSKTKSRRKRK